MVDEGGWSLGFPELFSAARMAETRPPQLGLLASAWLCVIHLLWSISGLPAVYK